MALGRTGTLITKMPDTVNIKYFNACSSGKVGIVSKFLDAGVSTEARESNGLTGLILAGRNGHVEVAKVLLERGAAIDAVDRRGRKALFHAVTYRRYEFVEYLASVGANVSPIDEHGWTPLDFSRVSNHDRMAALLVKLGALTGQGSS